jgi:hypothetical protein
VKRTREGFSPLGEAIAFKVVAEGSDKLTDADRKELLTFQRQVAKLSLAYNATVTTANELSGKLDQMKRALDQAPKAKPETRKKILTLIDANRAILRELRGDTVLRARNENTPVSIGQRIGSIRESQARSTAKPTTTTRESYRIASEELAAQLAKLKPIVETDVKEIEKELEAIGAAWVSGALPEWKEK